MPGPQELERRLRAIAALELILEDAKTQAVYEARDEGFTFTLIAKCMGVSKQQIQHTYKDITDLASFERQRHRRTGEMSLRLLDSEDLAHIAKLVLELYVSARTPQTSLRPWSIAVRAHLSDEFPGRRTDSNPRRGWTSFALSDVEVEVICEEPVFKDGEQAPGSVTVRPQLDRDPVFTLVPELDFLSGDLDSSIQRCQAEIRGFVTTSIDAIRGQAQETPPRVPQAESQPAAPPKPEPEPKPDERPVVLDLFNFDQPGE